MVFIATKFGFIASFERRENYEGELVWKARHCIDIREAKPFPNRGEAEKAYRMLGVDWYHCIVSSDEPDREAKALLQRSADSLQDYCADANGDMNDGLAMEIYRFLGED